MHAWTAEHRLLATEILLPEIVHEGIYFGVEEVKVIHSIVLTGQLGLVLCEGQDVCGSIYLGYDIHSVLLSQLLELYKLLLGIGAVLGGQAGISVTLKAEARLSLAPVIAEVLAETAVVEVHLQGVHLIVRHHLGQIAQVRDGDVLASAVDHETAHTVIGLVGDDALGQSLAFCLLVDLQQCTCSPHDTLGGGSCEGHIGSDVDAVTLLALSASTMSPALGEPFTMLRALPVICS